MIQKNDPLSVTKAQRVGYIPTIVFNAIYSTRTNYTKKHRISCFVVHWYSFSSASKSLAFESLVESALESLIESESLAFESLIESALESLIESPALVKALKSLIFAEAKLALITKAFALVIESLSSIIEGHI